MTLSPFFLSSVQAKASGKKLQKVTLKVSPRGIILYDSVSNQLMENVSIYRLVVPFDSLIYASPSQFGSVTGRILDSYHHHKRVSVP